MIEEKLGEEILDLDSFPGSNVKVFNLIMTVIVQYTEKHLFNSPDRWSLSGSDFASYLGILANDYSSLLSFIVDLAIYFDCPYTLPPITLVVTCIQVSQPMT
jgi:hypothetical protein